MEINAISGLLHTSFSCSSILHDVVFIIQLKSTFFAIDKPKTSTNSKGL